MTQEEYIQFIILEMSRRNSLPRGEVDFLFGSNKENAESLSAKLKENKIRHKLVRKSPHRINKDTDSFVVTVLLTPVGSLRCKAIDIDILSFDKSRMTGEEALQFIENAKTARLNLYHANFTNLLVLYIEDVINLLELSCAVSRHMATENWEILVDILSFRHLKGVELRDALMMWKMSN